MSITCIKIRPMVTFVTSLFFGLSAPLLAIASEEKQVKPAAIILAPPSDYCQNILKPAQEARYAFQLKTLEDLQMEIEAKLVLLDQKRLKNIAFESQKKEKMKVAQRQVVDIYSKMKPDIAAGQLELLDPETAVSILDQLKVKVSSSILNEMKGQSAAVITGLMAGAAKVQQP
jgi:flagellar motility protein MotE (MotC chaperone)